MYPQLWAYKRGEFYFCTWSCLRLFDKEVGDMGHTKITLEQKKKAVQIAIEGGDPIGFLDKCGSENAAGIWYTIKKHLKENDPKTYDRLPDKYKPREKAQEPGKKVDVSIEDLHFPMKVTHIEETENGLKAEAVSAAVNKEKENFYDTVSADFTMEDEEAVKAQLKEQINKYGVSVALQYEQFTVREVEGLFGRYRRSDVGTTYIDFENADGCIDVMSLTINQWKNFIKELKRAAQVLGVEL
jgi:hypothetical protein